jgi:hypothetical protein
MSKLVAWQTPFQTEQFPSVWIQADGPLDKTTVFVGWPAEWQINFANVVAIKVCDESYDNNPRFHVTYDIDGLCSYTWENSPWLEDFNGQHIEAIYNSKLRHFVLLGGDYNVEVLAVGEASIKRLDSNAGN